MDGSLLLHKYRRELESQPVIVKNIATKKVTECSILALIDAIAPFLHEHEIDIKFFQHEISADNKTATENQKLCETMSSLKEKARLYGGISELAINQAMIENGLDYNKY